MSKGRRRYDHRITEKQKKFCEAYLANGRNARAAAREAGYGKSYAGNKSGEILKSTIVKQYLRKRLQKADKQLEATFDWKLRRLKQIADSHENNIAVSAIAEMNKMQGHYSPDKHVNANININSDADLIQVRDVMRKITEKHEKDY